MVAGVLILCQSYVKFYVKGRHNPPTIINLFVICVNLQKFTYLILQKANFGGKPIATLILLNASLSKSLSRSTLMLTILYKSALYFLGIGIQKIILYCLVRSRANYIRLNNLNIKKSFRVKLSRLFIYIGAFIYLLWYFY